MLCGGGSCLRAMYSARLRTLPVHQGRHTFISHALAGGRSLAEVRAAAGHSNVAITMPIGQKYPALVVLKNGG
jgi:integrase